MELLYRDPSAELPWEVGQRVEPPTALYDGLLPDPPPGRPFTAVNMVSAVDGKVTLGRGAVKEPIGSRVDHGVMDRLRLPFDAVLRGASTVRQFPYYPKVPAEVQAVRQARGQGAHPRTVVISGSCELPLEAEFFKFEAAPARPLVITKEAAPAENVRAAEEVAEVRFAGVDTVEIPRALRLLREEFGVERLLSEGGPRLNWEFLRAGVLDELFWTVAPKVGGYQEDLPLVRGPEVLDPLPRLHLLTLFHHEGELFLRYRVDGAGGAARP